ncbi:MAG TPA: 1-acyl-sn-glycerol-3-phosphate acyltransferase [Thermoanaerobaculia bacterium]
MVALPIWLVVLLIALATWAFVGHLVLPGARWVLQRRVNRVLEEIDMRLKIRIPPFKLTKREILISRLIDDSQVQEAADAETQDTGASRSAVRRRVEGYAREIVPQFNAYLYFRIGYAFARWVGRSLYRVRLGYSDEEGLAALDPNATVVFLINHRSNMDYILVSYLAAEKAALSYAVGEWARIWPLQTLIRAMGAYFVRRNSKDPLYRKVLERYVAMATAAGLTQAVFPEGGLSREGTLRPPKLGLLDYMVRAFEPAGRDVAFIPVGVNYDRVFEDRSFLIESDPAAPRSQRGGVVSNMLRFLMRNLSLMARNKWHRFGYACVDFGSPVSLARWAEARGVDFQALGREERFAQVEELGRELMAAVARVIPVVPVPLVATAFVRQPQRSRSELELKAEVLALMRELSDRGAHVYVPRKDQDYAIAVGLRTLTLRHLVEEKDGLYTARPEELPLLTYYANSVAHLFG